MKKPLVLEGWRGFVRLCAMRFLRFCGLVILMMLLVMLQQRG